MARQYFEGLLAEPQTATPTALVATTIEALWPAAQYSNLGPNTTAVGKVYEIKAFGTVTFGASGTLIITPSIGTSTGGTTLGASSTYTVPVSITTVWFLHALMVVRAISASGGGTGGSFMLGGVFNAGGILANTSPGANLCVPFGGTAAAVDTTIAPTGTTGPAITIGKTLSVAGSISTYAAVMQDIS